MNWPQFACGVSLGFGLGVLLSLCWPHLVQSARRLRLRLAGKGARRE